ncbi:hypothetical protein [Acetonema longum]|uniref:Tail assembly chaperone n=1 Tax=Acetonema longum DSM 6540 TaxID=1009370 RepID=F7NID7_9FIRM|nr:hypothetical protein [Acetonema longum]EGO64167.1 hypothetical protein ALO_09199 [Acetonema longum DSM 6540]
MSEQETVQELAALFPPTYELKLGGETVSLRPFKAGALPKLIPAMARLAGVLATMDWEKMAFGLNETSEERGVAAAFRISPETFQVVTALCEQGGETFKEIIALAVGRSPQWFDELDLAEGIELAGMVLMVNKDFFAKRLTEVLNKLIAVKGEQGASPGPKPSRN